MAAAETRTPAWKAAIARLPSGVKMLLLMGVALMPLGLIALFASLQYAAVKRTQHDADARLIATAEARQLDLVLMRAGNVVRLAAGAATGAGARCRLLVVETGRLVHPGTRIALFDRDGTLRCASPGFAPTGGGPPHSLGVQLGLLPDSGVRLAARADNGGYGVGELAPAALREALGTPDVQQAIALRQGGVERHLLAPARARAFDRSISVTAPLGGGQLALTSTIFVPAVAPLELLLVILPLMMWALAALIAWFVLNELLLRPIRRLEAAVSVATLADAASGGFAMPRLQSPAREIRSLGEAFATATDQIAQRESRLEEGLRHQVLLTREVHHRVKNNLQVVASLINLHARGASGDVADAYASIQRRVDALAVVHRNLYAELEKNRGVALRALIAELTANLRATAPPAAAHFAITLNLAPIHAGQDAAVPIAFLITEVIELLMVQAPTEAVRIALEPTGVPDRALLTIEAPGLRTLVTAADPAVERFGRIVAGLARQLRSTLAFDGDRGQYGIVIPALPELPPAEDA